MPDILTNVAARMRAAATIAQGRWFDATRRVQTSGGVSIQDLTLTGLGKSGFDYLPTRPAVARRMLADLPVANFSEYTFVDLGSGKGRMLFLASEYPFRKIRGVEFAAELHLQAQQNIARYRHSRQRCRDLESVHADAADYDLPAGKLVLYLFNPFGPDVLAKVLANLRRSLEREPRHLVCCILNPEFAEVIDQVPALRLHSQTDRFRVYQTTVI